jgi:gamma-glutamylcyclotransferase (GGCT)/AIG2-like uncharacterized protein YtfP
MFTALKRAYTMVNLDADKLHMSGEESVAFRMWLSEANKAGMYSPDIARLQMKRNHHVFLYGTEMEGHRNHFKFCGNSGYLGIAFTFARDFVMWKKAVGDESFPFALRGVSSTKTGPSRVCGELYDLTPKQVICLDEHLLNTVQFDRVRLKVVVPHVVVKGVGDKVVRTLSVFPPIECWMYVGKTRYWEDLLDGGMQYPVVKSRTSATEFKHFNNSFRYSVQEHNDFKVTSKRTVP